MGLFSGPRDQLPIVPEQGINEGFAPPDVDGLDCFERVTRQIAALPPWIPDITRERMRHQLLVECFPDLERNPLVNTTQFLTWAPMWVPPNLSSPCCDWSSHELEENCPTPVYGRPGFPANETWFNTSFITIASDCRTRSSCSFRGEAATMLGMARGYLEQNDDIVRWAICASYCGAHRGRKHERIYDCVKNKIDNLQFDVRCSDILDSFLGGFFAGLDEDRWIHVGGPNNNTIAIQADEEGGRFLDWVEAFCTEPGEQGGNSQRMCLAIYVASVVLALLVAACDDDPVASLVGVVTGAIPQTRNQEQCRTSRIVQRTFLWGALNRYPNALDSDCCAPWNKTTGVANPDLVDRSAPIDDLLLSAGNTALVPGC